MTSRPDHVALFLWLLRQRSIVLVDHLPEAGRHVTRTTEDRTALVRALHLTAQGELERLESLDERVLQALHRRGVVVVLSGLELTHLLDHPIEIRRIHTHLLQLTLQRFCRLALFAELARELADVIGAQLPVRRTALSIAAESPTGTLLIVLATATHLAALARLLASLSLTLTLTLALTLALALSLLRLSLTLPLLPLLALALLTTLLALLSLTLLTVLALLSALSLSVLSLLACLALLAILPPLRALLLALLSTLALLIPLRTASTLRSGLR